VKFHTILLDGDILLHRAVARNTTKIQWEETAEVSWTVNIRSARLYILAELSRLRTRLGAERVLIALGDRKANFRKELYPQYKAHRSPFPKPPGFLELEEQMRANTRTFQEDRLEGDDMLGLLATKEPLDGKVVVTVDKDLRQIPGWNYNMDTDELREIGEPEAAEHHLVQTLTGDRTDNYPGCPGVGPVRAARILAQVGDPWTLVVAAYEKAGLSEEDALLQARLARILRQGDYDRSTKEIKLWNPN
jgi:DNA polymerase-1